MYLQTHIPVKADEKARTHPHALAPRSNPNAL